MADSVKSLVDQLREIDKLVSDGMDKLSQAKLGLRSLEERLNTRTGEPRDGAAGPPNNGIKSSGTS